MDHTEEGPQAIPIGSDLKNSSGEYHGGRDVGFSCDKNTIVIN